MLKLSAMVVGVAIVVFGSLVFAGESNGVGMVSTNQNVAPNVSNAELQAEAKSVLWMVVAVWIVALVGALVVAGFAVYGAYRKFGTGGVAVVLAILIFGAWLFGDFLLSF